MNKKYSERFFNIKPIPIHRQLLPHTKVIVLIH